MASYSVLVDSSTDAVLTVNWHVAALQFVHEWTMDTAHIAAANLPNYLKQFPLARELPQNFPTWTWVEKTRSFERTHPDTATPELRSKAELSTAKTKTISFMIHRLNHGRNKVRTGLDFQELIYIAKEMQARLLKASGFDTKLIVESPYVVYYADALGIPLEQAAEEILLQAKLDHEYLAKTEKVRMEFFRKVRDAKDPKELPALLSDFKRQA